MDRRFDRGISQVITSTVVHDLEKICPGGVFTDISLAGLSRWKIGGNARLLVRPHNQEQTVKVRKYFSKYGIPHVVFGMTSNLLFDDRGLLVPCIQIGSEIGKFSYIPESDSFNIEAGAWVPGISRKLLLYGYTGAEHICGIPGTMGGLICMNGGSQRKGIGASVLSVTSLDIQGNIVHRNVTECGFGYRESIFQSVDEIILNAQLKFARTESRSASRREMLRILSDRRTKFPQKMPNCGSVFKSNPAMYDKVGPPGKVVENLGFKGKRLGGAVVSTQHANFIVNEGGATCKDVLALISEIYFAVLQETGYKMDVEAKLVTDKGIIKEICLDSRAPTERYL